LETNKLLYLLNHSLDKNLETIEIPLKPQEVLPSEVTDSSDPNFEYKHKVTADTIATRFNNGEYEIALITKKDEPFKGRLALPGGHVN